jgi:hypothetical protein
VNQFIDHPGWVAKPIVTGPYLFLHHTGRLRAAVIETISLENETIIVRWPLAITSYSGMAVWPNGNWLYLGES